MSTFEHKTVYHSALVQASDPGGLLVRFKGTPRKSKFKGKPPFIAFEVSGDQNEYLYNIENGDIESYLSHAPQDQWVTLFAGGSHDSATVRLEEADGNPVLPGTGDGPPPNEWPNEYQAPAAKPGGSDMVARFGEVYGEMKQIVGPVGDASNAALIEAAQKITVTEAIEASR